MKREDTEQLIKSTAKEIFFARGRINAKLHEIASAAKVNRALMHYYFRSRENLFDVVFREAMHESFLMMFEILNSDKEFEEKIEEAVHHIVDVLNHYPYIESFIISEINKNPSSAGSISAIRNGKNLMTPFMKEIAAYLRKRKIGGIRPEQFMVNMMSLCAYPSSTKPIIRKVLSMTEKEYQDFMDARRKMLTCLVLMKYR
jgi:TetR/AcrR family transcriptional regulator